MSDYKEMYLKLFRVSEKAADLLVEAQWACEELYISQPEPELKVFPLPSESENEKSEDAK